MGADGFQQQLQPTGHSACTLFSSGACLHYWAGCQEVGEGKHQQQGEAVGRYVIWTAGHAYSIPLFLFAVGEQVTPGHLLLGPLMGLAFGLHVEYVLIMHLMDLGCTAGCACYHSADLPSLKEVKQPARKAD